GALAVHVHAERPGGAPAPAGLLGAEEAEEDAAARVGPGDGECARGAELVVERDGADLVGVEGRFRGPLDVAAEFALRVPGVVRGAVAEVLGDGRELRRHDVVVVPLPAGILVEALALGG